MSYPKPLSKQRLDKLYAEAGISAEQSAFLHQFFHACANLYGTLSVRDAWYVYKELAGKRVVPVIKRKMMNDFSALVRREALPYFVFELSELYSEEQDTALDRQIVNNDLVAAGYGKYYRYYQLLEQQEDRPFYVPEQLLDFAKGITIPEEERLRTFLSGLKVTARKSETPRGKEVSCEHFGERLDSFDFLNQEEQFEISYLSGEVHGRKKQAAALADFRLQVKGPESEKILRNHIKAMTYAQNKTTDRIQNIMDELCEVGVKLSEKQTDKLLNLLTELNNHSYLACNRGCPPMDAAKEMSFPHTLTLGPGIQKAMDDGSMDREELLRGLRAMGFEIQE